MDINSYFKAIDYSEIERYVSEKRAEDVHLEFKRAVHLDANDHTKNSDKKNLSKCISGFANSDGGIIVWGVEAKQNGGVDYASKLIPIKEVRKFLNRLNSLEGSAVSPTVDGIQHEIIILPGEEDSGFVKSYIPSSENAPHMANYADKHYYKRSGDSFYLAEHYDVADMFARATKPDLNFKFFQIGWRWVNESRNRIRIEVVFGLENTGRAIAKFPFVSVYINMAYKFADFGLDGNGFIGLKRLKRNQALCDYMGGSDVVVYPGISLEVDKIRGEFLVPMDDRKIDLRIEYQIAAENMEMKEGEVKVEVDDALQSHNYLH